MSKKMSIWVDIDICKLLLIRGGGGECMKFAPGSAQVRPSDRPPIDTGGETHSLWFWPRLR